MSNTYGNPYIGGNQINPYSNIGGQQINPYSTFGGNQVNPYTTPMMIPGRVVTSDKDIMPSEVSMDGRLILFPLSDYSCIYAKQWDRNGNGIITVKYVPEVVHDEEENEKSTTFDMASLHKQLEEIKKDIQSISSRYRSKPKNQRYKKNQNGSNYYKKDVNDA